MFFYSTTKLKSLNRFSWSVNRETEKRMKRTVIILPYTCPLYRKIYSALSLWHTNTTSWLSLLTYYSHLYTRTFILPTVARTPTCPGVMQSSRCNTKEPVAMSLPTGLKLICCFDAQDRTVVLNCTFNWCFKGSEALVSRRWFNVQENWCVNKEIKRKGKSEVREGSN